MNIAQMLIDKWQGKTTHLKEDYKSRLSHGVWMIEFAKVDGTLTSMECTLDPNFMPPAPLKESTTPRAEPEHFISVYSLDRGGWRSFTVANVKAFYQKAEVY
jgi:hypothetical protein